MKKPDRVTQLLKRLAEIGEQAKRLCRVKEYLFTADRWIVYGGRVTAFPDRFSVYEMRNGHRAVLHWS